MIFAALVLGLLVGLVLLDEVGKEDSRPAPIPVKSRETPAPPANPES